jgi:hypothetical protein
LHPDTAVRYDNRIRGDWHMIWTIAVILFILWLLGFAVFQVGGALIHALLVIAAIVIVWRLVTGSRTV